MLHSSGRHTPGVTIELSLALAEQSFEVNAQVMWCRVPTPALESRYLTGVRFLNLSTQQYLSIGQYLLAEAQRQDAMAPKALRTRRLHPRIGIATNVLKTCGLTALDLSEPGMMLSCSEEQRVGSDLVVELELDGNRLCLSAVIRRCRPSPTLAEPEHCLGLEFVSKQ
jgi:hypothetical protein